ncbi:hypothetical protein B0U12_15170 [Listeria monocytogenes]|nr:hypothetical protein [Listeria monocytogenes]EAC9023817.1 hypothetical protein [Listeria monocytogenes]EAC9287003.1 hypothetical protein [Listeria monocytogenes]EAC9512730.1 hypothetical protein [Listeria monocytogenes]EAE9702814.1 hypothetical protein [Listeria monocytogenes]
MKYEEEKHPLFNQEALDQYVEDTSQYYTENMKNAMHLWPNGKMTSSTYEGVRGDDHQVISNYFDNIDMPELTKLKRSEVMKVAAEGVGVLIVVPEIEKILKAKNQVLTDKQIQVVCKNNFELDYFSEGIVLTKEKMEAYGVTEAQIQNLAAKNQAAKENKALQLGEVEKSIEDLER